jgi:type III secretion protein Q
MGNPVTANSRSRWSRLEIGRIEVAPDDINELAVGDVVLCPNITARPDKCEGGVARLRGGGRVQYATVAFEGPRALVEVVESDLPGVDPLDRLDPSGVIDIELARFNRQSSGCLPNGYRIELGPVDSVGLSVRGDLIARGQIVEVEGSLGVRILKKLG